jgi:hypothetical protein
MAMIYVAFLTCLAGVFTPIIESEARMFAGFFLFVMFIFVSFDAANESDKKQP